jgi:hypothetical protein
MSDPMRDQRGQIMIAGAIFLLILILVAGGLLDVYRLQEARDWAYRAAEAAALNGAARGRDFAPIYSGGSPRIDPGVGWAAAEETLQAELVQRGLTGATYQIEVSEWGGDTLAGFPPVARADLWNAADWQPTAPSVGVYVELPIETFLLGLTHQGVVTVHAFAAAGLGRQ